MRISIKTILGKEVGSTYEESFSEELPQLLLDEDVRLLSPVSGDVRILKANHAFLVNVHDLNYDVELVCDRCTKKFIYHVKAGNTGIREFYVKKPEEFQTEVDEDVFRVDMTFRAVELDELLRQEILVALPAFRLCSEDCKGLQQKDTSEHESPFSVLREIIK